MYQEGLGTSLGVHNFMKKELYNYTGEKTRVYRDIYGILSAFVFFITARTALRIFFTCYSYLWKLKLGLNIHINIPNFEEVGLNICDCMPWKQHADKQGFAI